MQVRTLSGEQIEIRSNEFGSTDPLRLRLLEASSVAGVPVTQQRALSLVTVTQCIRLAAHMVASLRAGVYKEGPDTVMLPVEDAWQTMLLANPSLDSTPYDLVSDISASVDGFGNAFVLKVKAKVKRKTQVVELRVIPADRVRVYAGKNGEKLFDVKSEDGRRVTKGLTPDDILHVRGFTFGGRLSGLSPVEHFHNTFGIHLGVNEFAGRYFSNDATPGGYISLPVESELEKPQLDEILDMWEERHGGIDNKHRPAILQGGAEYKTAAVSAQTAQLLESQAFQVEDLARMMDWPVEFLVDSKNNARKAEETMDRLLVLHVRPRAERIASAFNSDPDLFLNDTTVKFDFNWRALKVADTDAKSNEHLRMRQGGILTANEVRAERGYPPHADGDVLQMTPVGGEANPGLDGGGSGGHGQSPKDQPHEKDDAAGT